jgi:HPt (histidine-containing phosphotransfer) domain-containing protein
MTDASEPSIDAASFRGVLDAVGGDREFLAELVAAFEADAPVQVTHMRGALEARSPEGIVRPAHTLKGSSASLGALRLSRHCGRLEASSRSGELDGAAETIDEIEMAVQVALAELQQLTRTP